MSDAFQERRRRILKLNYKRRLSEWMARRPPKRRLIAYLRWKNEKPKRTW